MTMFEAITSSLQSLISKFLNEDDEDRADANEPVDEQLEAHVCSNLDTHLAKVIRDLNEERMAVARSNAA